MNKKLFIVALLTLSAISSFASHVPEIKWDRQSLLIDGKRKVPVMGEIHYSRLPENEWRMEIRKMKEGGVTIIATYVFWNHIEEIEGQYDWSGRRNLRAFLEICKNEQMPVILRLGPYCHGEVRNGGIPDWFFDKGIKIRSCDPQFLALTGTLYRQIFTQVQGLQWKDGGPVIACQFDNEYCGSGDYLMALKEIATKIGFDLPFYTRTGWPELSKPVPLGEMLPLYGDYADGFWDRSIKEGAGNYWKAFFFKAFRSSTAIATEQIKHQKETASRNDEQYPYFTCELGGGMTTAYHRRPYMYPDDALAMAVVKLGSGSNLLGYYMYHGGTNPEGKLTYLNENQKTAVTNYNDLPVKSYEFHGPLGEFGQKHEAYYRLRPLHLFMYDYAETLAPMEAILPDANKEIKKGDDSYLRWSYRQNGSQAFVFFNNYERLRNLTAKKNIQFKVGDVVFPQKPVTIPANAVGIFPVNVEDIHYATAQLVANREGKVYLMQIKDIPVEIVFQNGKKMKNVKAKGLTKPVYKNYYLLSEADAEHLFLTSEAKTTTATASYQKTQETGKLRTITIGVNKVAEEPQDSDFNDAAVYIIYLPQGNRGLLDINYRGDCARLYADGKLIDDNFYNGCHFQYGLWRLPDSIKQLELRILPIQKDEPVYFPREADKIQGEDINSITVITEQ